MKNKYKYYAVLLVLAFVSCLEEKEISVFDGHSLEGWEGDNHVFKVENGCIVGGSQEFGLEKNYYLYTTEEYSDFELSLSVKLIDTNQQGNSGVSFRANSEMDSTFRASYQADIGYIDPFVVAYFSNSMPADTVNPFSLWGTLLDEGRAESSRYSHPEAFPVAILNLPERELVDRIVIPNDWNEVQVRAVGKEIEIKINGVTTTRFTESMYVTTTGVIGLQVHAGDPFEVCFKDIIIRKLD